MIPNPWLLLGALVSMVAIATGGYLYGEHQQANADQVKAQALQIKQDQLASDAQTLAARDTRALQAAADVRAARLQDQIDQSRVTYDTTKARAALAHVAACPIPADAIGVLFAPAGAGAGQARTVDPGPAGGSAPRGVVDATDIALNAELNRGAFERNLDRLASCIGAYDTARAKVNPP